MNTTIITGTSRGLGEALAYQLLSAGHQLFCISRHKNEKLIQHAKEIGGALYYLEQDLAQLQALEKLMGDIFNKINPSQLSSLNLINNAGALTPIKPVGKSVAKEMIQNLSINAQAPIVLTSEFMRLSSKLSAKRTVINISSGAGKKPYYGWSCYCSAKAAIDMFTRCAGLEQAKEINPVRVLSFAPGIIDTDMQAEIRTAKEEDFELVQRFKAYKENGNLKTPQYVADKVMKLMSDNQFETGAVLDIQDI